MSGPVVDLLEPSSPTRSPGIFAYRFPQSVAALSWIDDILGPAHKPACQRRNGGAHGA
jgi:hypothetical protein